MENVLIQNCTRMKGDGIIQTLRYSNFLAIDSNFQYNFMQGHGVFSFREGHNAIIKDSNFLVNKCEFDFGSAFSIF